MSLPEQIQKQVDQAKAIVAQHYGPKDASATEETSSADQTPAAEPTTVEPEAQAQPAPAAAESQPKPEPVTTSSDDENNTTYAQRWRSLQGVYNATKRQLDEAAGRISSLETLVSQMNTAKADAPQQDTRHVTDSDRSTFGEDMVEFARRVSREEVAPLAQAVKMLMSRLDQLQGVVPVVQNVAAAQAKTAHEMFYDALGKRVADWQTVNENGKFHEWLLSPDPLSGLTRQSLLEDAHRALDLDRVVNIFELGKQAIGVRTPAPAAAQAASAAKASQLEKQIAPGRASTGTAAPKPAEKKQWTRAEISKFYSDKQRGVYKGREQEASALERDIFTAQREGRVALNA